MFNLNSVTRKEFGETLQHSNDILQLYMTTETLHYSNVVMTY